MDIFTLFFSISSWIR